MTPKKQGKRGIDTAEGCNEMIIPSANFLLRSIVAMVSSWCELKSNVIRCHETLEQGRGFIVQFLEFWLKFANHKVGMDDSIVPFHLWGASTIHGFDKDVVAIIIINE